MKRVHDPGPNQCERVSASRAFWPRVCFLLHIFLGSQHLNCKGTMGTEKLVLPCHNSKRLCALEDAP